MIANISAAENSQANMNGLEISVLMWADASVNNMEENRKAQETLTKFYKKFTACENIGECEKAIQQLAKTDRTILVISGSLGKELIPHVHELEQISIIYIFCMDQTKYLELATRFKKIKAVIVDLSILISTIESDYQQQIFGKKTPGINIPNINSKLENETNGKTGNMIMFRYSFKYFVNAGELKYTEKTMKDIASEIVNQFKSDPNRNFNGLIFETTQPIMYLLKREQNLMDFIGPLKRLLSKEKDISCVSQRLLIDTIMMNSDPILCRRLTSLLSKRNAVPMIQPQLESLSDKCRSISNLIHVWDYHRPVFLSFGIGLCKGKTMLINSLFHSNFEQSTKDKYFVDTIDIDFGYNFVERRPINIADAHGEITIEILAQISKLFAGFLVHIDSKYLCSNQSNVIKYLKLLPSQNYILIFIRDVDDENDKELELAIQNALSTNCKICYLPNVSDKDADENKEKIDEARDTIFSTTNQSQYLDEKSIQEHLKILMDDTQKAVIKQDMAFIDSIRSILINGQENYYLLYSSFINLCKKRLEMAKMDPYEKDFRSERLYQLNLDLFKADSEFKERLRMGPSAYGAGFQSFIDLLQRKDSRSSKLYLLSTELKKEAAKKGIDQTYSFYNQLYLEIHWRNAFIGSTYLSNDEQNMLVQTYRDYIDEGNPFEIVDGDNFEMQSDFLTKVFQLFPNKKIFVISIIGPQNSGKSTLLNFLFGTLFEARDGRCTKGIYGTLINVQGKATKNKLVLNYDYILVIDTEGLLSIQKGDEQYDKRIILFCLAVSHLVIVNVGGEIDDPMRKFFTVCTQTLKYLGETRVKKPTVHFVLNKRDDPNEKYCKELLEYVRTTLKEKELDNEINLKEDNFHALTRAFNHKPTKISNGKCAAIVTNIQFVTNVQKLCEFLIESSLDIIRQTGDCFCIPIHWIEFANRILQTIKKHPNLTHFKDIFERDQYEKVRNDIRQDFDQYLSPTVAHYLMDKEKQYNTDRIKVSFKAEYERILKILEEKLQKHCQECEASEDVKNRSSIFIQKQLNSIFRSWEVSAIMRAERYKIDQTSNKIENKLRDKAVAVTHKNCLIDKQSATEMFENELKGIFIEIKIGFDSESVWKQSIEMVSHLCTVLDGDILPSGDNVIVHLPFLNIISASTDQSISMKDCLSKIRDKFQFDASNICPLTTCSTDTSSTISHAEIVQPHTFLNNAELSRIYLNTTFDHMPTRDSMRKGARQSYCELFGKNWKTIVQISTCFNVLLTDIEKILTSTNSDESSTEIALIQKILGAVKKVIQDFNNELKKFNYCLSKQFLDPVYIYALLSTALYYYNQQKTHFLHVIQAAQENKSKLIERFLPWVILIQNDDKNVAINRVNDICQEFSQSMESQIKEIIENHINTQITMLNRSSIIKELDDEVYNASDDWLKIYVLDPIDLIIKRFNEKWMEIKTSLDVELGTTKNFILNRLKDIFCFIQEINTSFEKRGGHCLSFVDSLFQLKGQQSTSRQNDKQFCMAKLFHLYLINAKTPTEITTINGLIYTVDAKWKTIIETLPKPSIEIQNIFCSLESEFETSTISYLGVFLEEILKQENEIKTKMLNQIDSFIQKTYRLIEERLNKQLRSCRAHCPACKRICDVDHHLNMTSPIGQGENRHRCQLGHQIRGMGGVCYEITNEASISWCEMIQDDHPITLGNNIRQTWKAFKTANNDWDFGDGVRGREILKRSYAYIWEKIGPQLCDHFGDGMIFVKQNSPIPVNHFIFVLDHSGSMNEKERKTSTQSTTSANQTNPNAWEHLLRAVKGFIDIREKQVSLNDQITIILFGSRAERIYNREKLKNIDFDRINTSMNVYGGGTNFSAAFQVVIKSLEELSNNPNSNNLRQTIIFMTDGEPQGYPTVELQRLCEYRRDATNQNVNASIDNFWTMALGNFNKRVIEQINDTMQGKLVNIEQPEDLVEAYAQIAEKLTV